MQSFNSFLKEGKNTPHAVWVVGGAASGKSTIAEKAIIKDMGFILIDVDKPFEALLKKFKLGADIMKSTDAQKAAAKIKKAKLDADIKSGKVKAPPKMSELKDPMDYFKTNKPTTNRASVVAREINTRTKNEALEKLRNVCFVETGGQIGRIRNEKKAMEEMGYSTFIVYVAVHADLDLTVKKNYDKVKAVITERGLQRGKAGGRNLDPKILETSLNQTVKVQKELVPLFKKNMLVIDTAMGDPADNQKKTTMKLKRWMNR